MNKPLAMILWTFVVLSAWPLSAEEKPLAQDWDYAAAMKKVAARGKALPGVVLHVGDSITYANPYSGWARGGAGQTDEDRAALKWMHAGADDNTDGWYLARFDHADGGRSYTAAGGIRTDETLAGGKAKMPPLAKLLDEYRPQAVVVMLGTNDASARRGIDDFTHNIHQIVMLMLERGIVPIISTIPPHVGQRETAKNYNVAIRQLAKQQKLPLIDYEAEILARRPDDWDGTLLGKGDVHPTASQGGANANSAPTAENLRNSGYLLRGWLSVKKIAEVKRLVFDGAPAKAEPRAEARPTAKPKTAQPQPKGDVIRVPITRDTWLSEVGKEADGSNGGSNKLKLKSIQEMTLVDFDPTPLKGRAIVAATLHTFGHDLRRVTASTFAADWVEGTASNYDAQAGSSTFHHRVHPDTPWTIPGSDLCAVMLGQGGTTWRMAEAQLDATDGWQQIPVDPSILAARVAGVSYGVLLFDDTGSEWTRDGEKFKFAPFPNRYIASRDSGEKTAPYFTVTLGAADTNPPDAVKGFVESRSDDLPNSEAIVSWLTPADKGASGTAGFLVTIGGEQVPRYLIPAAQAPGERVQMHVRDLKLAAANAKLSIQAIDGAGNVGPASDFAVQLANRKSQTLLSAIKPSAKATATPLPKLADAEIAIIDALDKVHPATDEMIPPQSPEYLSNNHLWNAKTPQIQLHAAHNELVNFQILVRGVISGLQPELKFDNAPPGLEISFGRMRHVGTKQGPLPDPVVPLEKDFSVPAADEKIADQKSGSLVCEIYIPRETKAQELRGTLKLRAGNKTLELPVTIGIWDFTLPDVLSFLPEMNCYGLPENEGAYYRLAQRHRTVLNRVPYHQNGHVDEGLAPPWDGKRLDWTAWDKRFGPYFDGSAFKGSPRAGVPIECFYLPIHESWPLDINKHYNNSYWADEAFDDEYRQTLVEVSKQFAQHFDERGWHQTLFHLFLNGKNNFKQNGWSRGSSPWLLDEPANWQDYWALRWFGRAFHEGIHSANSRAKLLYRCDISRPQWQRDAFDTLLDYNVVAGGAFRQYHRLVQDRKRQFGQIVVEYGTSNAITDSNLQAVGWALDSWSLGSDGILPWQVIGNSKSWQTADELSLFYPPLAGSQSEPIPSIRLKAYCRAQQDAEYLTMLALATEQPRWAVGQQVRDALRLTGERKSSGYAGPEDAGVIHYSKLLPHDVAALRYNIAKTISDKHPVAKRAIAPLSTPPRDPSLDKTNYLAVGHEPSTQVVLAEPKPSNADKTSIKETTPTEKPLTPGATLVLQGRKVVKDTLLDFSNPDRAAGGEPRGNALRRADQVCPLLVKFDVASLKLPKNAKLASATLSFYVWDPSSAGNTKVAACEVLTPWDEATASWRQSSAGKPWSAGEFTLGKDTATPLAPIVVKPEAGADTVDPPVEYQLDVTAAAKSWLAGKPNHGVAITPIIDRAVDEGIHSRFQVYASESPKAEFTPKLTLRLAK